MNKFARFDENPAMTLRVIKETKRYGRTHGRTDARTDGQRENSIPPTNKVCGGYKQRENIPSTIFQLYRDGSYFLVYQPKDVVGTQKNHLNQTVLFEHQK